MFFQGQKLFIVLQITAYVNSKGVYKGVKSGTATITAKVVQNKKTYYVNLAVKVCDPQKDWYKKGT